MISRHVFTRYCIDKERQPQRDLVWVAKDASIRLARLGASVLQNIKPSVRRRVAIPFKLMMMSETYVPHDINNDRQKQDRVTSGCDA